MLCDDGAWSPARPLLLTVLSLLVGLTGCERAGELESLADRWEAAGEAAPRGEDLAGPEEAGEPVVARAEAGLDDETREAIEQAAVAYVRAETMITDVTTEIEAVADGWARVRVTPVGDLTDPATLYLQAFGREWQGVVIGTGFTPDDLDRLGIPPGVRPAP